MKKNLVYLLTLLALGFVTYYFVFKEDRNAFDTSEANFTVKDTNTIQSIFISNLQNENIKLKHIHNEWILNDSLVPRQEAISLLLVALNQQKPEQPVSIKLHDEVLKNLSATGIKVEIFTDKGKTNTFYVANVAGPDNVTYMLTEGAKRPYIVKIPLQDYFLGVRYITKLNDWRDKRIMPATKDEIEYIHTEYKDSIQHSFKIEQQKGVRPSVTGLQAITKPINYLAVTKYLESWQNNYCYGYEERNKIKDTIFEHGKQVATIFLKKIGKPEQSLTLFFKPISKGTKSMIKLDGVNYDFDVFIGLLNKQNMMTVNKTTVRQMLPSLQDFYLESK